MKNYFYSHRGVKNGPFTLDQLQGEHLSPETLIWHNELDEWTPIRELSELHHLIVAEFVTKDISTVEPKPRLNASTQNTSTNIGRIEVNSTIPQKLFSRPFSGTGRIRRLEYGISFLIFVILNPFIQEFISNDSLLGFIGWIALMWFIIAQGVKRAHDLNQNGLWIIVPFYGFWLLFAKGTSGTNKYGENPKHE